MHSNLDTEPARRFLRLLDPETKRFTFQAFHDKKPPTKPELARVVESPAKDELLQLHAHGAGVYVTVNQTDGKGRRAENVVRIRAVFQEDDSNYDGVFPLQPSMVVQSSPGHFQRYWLAADDWAADEQGRKDFTAVLERLVESYGSDKNAKDIVRVLRVPGFLHRKGDPHLVSIVEASGKRYSRAEILAAFPKVEREQKRPQAEWKPQKDEDHRIREALDRINADDRYVWIQIGMALKDEYGEGGRGLWDDWSRRSKKFEKSDQEKTWRSLKRNGIGIGTLFHLAQRAGWRDERPSSGRSESKPDNPRDEDASERPTWRERTFTAEQLQGMTFPPVSWVLPGIIPGEGLTLLCSKPKFGKSWLAYDLCIASTAGRYTLGEIRPAQGDVLYLALEDSRRRLQRRMGKLLPTFNAKWPEKLTITTEWRRLHEGGLDDIREWHAQTKDAGGRPIMVVIDVLAKVRKPAGNKHLYDADYEAIGVLAHLAHELGIAIVAIHHTRKMAADDQMEMVSGSFGTTGAADTVLVLANKAGGAVLDIRGRDVESAEKAAEFNKDTCRWRILGDSAEIHVSEQRSKIIAALKEANEPMIIAALIEATWMKRNPLELLLGKMAKVGDIKRIGKGLYAHTDYAPPPPPDKPSKAKSVRSVSSVFSGQITGQMSEPTQNTDNKENRDAICRSVQSVHESTDADSNPVMETTPRGCL
jgi:hypothetical protein